MDGDDGLRRREFVGGAAGFFVLSAGGSTLAPDGDRGAGSGGANDGGTRPVPNPTYETAVVDTVAEAEQYEPQTTPAYVFVWETQETWRITDS